MAALIDSDRVSRVFAKAHPRRAVGRPYVHRQDQHSACLEVVKRLPLKCTVVRRYLHAQLGE